MLGRGHTRCDDGLMLGRDEVEADHKVPGDIPAQ